MKNEPNFERLKSTLFCQETDSVPLIELVIDKSIKEKFMGKPVDGLQGEIDFRKQAGYDYIWLSAGLIDPAGTVEKKGLREEGHGKYFNLDDDKNWAEEGIGKIKDFKDFEKYDWIDPGKVNYSDYKKTAELLPPGMNIIGIAGKIFTSTWMLMGLNGFSYALIENPKLVEAMFERIGKIQFEVFKKIIEFHKVGAIWVVDDIAYTEGLMVSPEILQKNLFPWYKLMGNICREKRIPLIYHSDGNLMQVMDDLLDIGIKALHPIEPKAMNARTLKEKVKGRICLLGNIDLDLLTRGTKDQVRELTKNTVKALAPGGGYCAGSSNSIPDYVPIENYKTMIETIYEYGKYPFKKT
ncbi:MAG: uroporphyrinogen decarboxylase family protein [Elusimicrobia bacterium]|nr:uroporphyrinogen decarboxylase family protein [Elusimicrobiota bacterium]